MECLPFHETSKAAEGAKIKVLEFHVYLPV